MFKKMRDTNPALSDKLMQRSDQAFKWLMGRQLENVETSAIYGNKCGVIAGVHFCKMYYQRVNSRECMG